MPMTAPADSEFAIFIIFNQCLSPRLIRFVDKDMSKICSGQITDRSLQIMTTDMAVYTMTFKHACDDMGFENIVGTKYQLHEELRLLGLCGQCSASFHTKTATGVAALCLMGRCCIQFGVLT